MQEKDLGRIEVSQQVIASIAGHAANGCYGIVAMAARGLRDGIAERLQRENLHRGVEVKVDPDGINIDLYCVVEYGVRITEVAHSLQDAVRYQVEKALGINVKTVNVNVQGIHLQEDDVPKGLDREREKEQKKVADG
ncbi:MAG: Asp23/Gls24 family envelope stress response protein [Candidatus Dormiibacterota bacterium]